MAKPPPEERGSEHIQTGGGIQEVESEGGEFCGQSLNGRKGSYATEVAETQVQQGTTNAPRQVTANKKGDRTIGKQHVTSLCCFHSSAFAVAPLLRCVCPHASLA